MAEFVLMKAKHGGLIPVNPDQVQYVANTELGPALVFGAMPGGFHQVHVEGRIDEIVETLTKQDTSAAWAALRAIRNGGCREGEAQTETAKTAPADAEAVEGKRRRKA